MCKKKHWPHWKRSKKKTIRKSMVLKITSLSWIAVTPRRVQNFLSTKLSSMQPQGWREIRSMGSHGLKTASSDVNSVLLHPLTSAVSASKFGNWNLIQCPEKEPQQCPEQDYCKPIQCSWNSLHISPAVKSKYVWGARASHSFQEVSSAFGPEEGIPENLEMTSDTEASRITVAPNS